MSKKDIIIDIDNDNRNQEFRILALIEEIFRNEYTKEENFQKKFEIKKKFLEVKLKIKKSFKMTQPLLHENIVKFYLTMMINHGVWNKPKNIFLL
jgi:hypothetical protein